MRLYNRTYVTVNLDAVSHNFDEMKKNLKEGVQMIAVLKANGYGHGAVPIAKEIESRQDIWGFAAATSEEALELKQAGIHKPILILGYVFEENQEAMISNDIRMTVFEDDTARQISEKAVRLGKKAPVHLALDTGMTRIGMKDTAESVELVKRICGLHGLGVEGMFTHFARADERDKQYAMDQFDRYLRFSRRLQDAGIRIPLLHCSNSAGILDLPCANLDLVRAGITIYGIYPSEEVDREKVKLIPAMEWKSHISFLKEVEPGVQISYGGTYTTVRKTRIATIPVGYADGYPRLLSGKGYVLIHGKKAPVLGRICMDQFMVDVTEIPEANPKDEVTLLGHDGGEVLPVETLSELCGRFPYEFVCQISPRVPRLYKKKDRILAPGELA